MLSFVQKNYFIGRLALEQFHRVGVRKRLVYFTLEDYDPETAIWPSKNEPIYRNGKHVGSVTSSAYVFDMLLIEFFHSTNCEKDSMQCKSFYNFSPENFFISFRQFELYVR